MLVGTSVRKQNNLQILLPGYGRTRYGTANTKVCRRKAS